MKEKMKDLKSVIKKELRDYTEDADIQVEFLMDLPIGVADALQDESLSEADRVFKLLAVAITDWNIADENGVKLSITEESIKRLGANLVKWLAQTAVEIMKPDEGKKKD